MWRLLVSNSCPHPRPLSSYPLFGHLLLRGQGKTSPQPLSMQWSRADYNGLFGEWEKKGYRSYQNDCRCVRK